MKDRAASVLNDALAITRAQGLQPDYSLADMRKVIHIFYCVIRESFPICMGSGSNVMNEEKMVD